MFNRYIKVGSLTWAWCITSLGESVPLVLTRLNRSQPAWSPQFLIHFWHCLGVSGTDLGLYLQRRHSCRHESKQVSLVQADVPFRHQFLRAATACHCTIQLIKLLPFPWFSIMTLLTSCK